MGGGTPGRAIYLWHPVQTPEEHPLQLDPPPELGVKPASLLWAKTDIFFLGSLDPHPGHWTAALRSRSNSSNSRLHF